MLAQAIEISKGGKVLQMEDLIDESYGCCCCDNGKVTDVRKLLE